jgi:hypothetical protein
MTDTAQSNSLFLKSMIGKLRFSMAKLCPQRQALNTTQPRAVDHLERKSERKRLWSQRSALLSSRLIGDPGSTEESGKI